MSPAEVVLRMPRVRPRRLRSSDALRRLVRETRLTPERLIAPLFVCDGEGVRRDIAAMPGCVVASVDEAVFDARSLQALGVSCVLLFGVPDVKDEEGSEAWNPDGVVPRAVRAIRREVPSMSVWTDVCLCAYTTHGHCGVLTRLRDGAVDVDNDASLPRIARVAVAHAAAGADVVAPSDMMDGRVRAVRAALDEAGHVRTAICSYAVKYASAFYGPFREAAGSRPAGGDRRGYQMDPANAREAVREARLDVAEGADLILVKPALAYLDVIRRVKRASRVPVVAYNVSGEYAMIRAAAARGWIDERAAIAETLTAMHRAGADAIVTYFAREAAALAGG